MSGILIEDIINEKLNDDAQKNALSFVSFMRENELSFESNDDDNGWALGGTVGDSIGYMMINGAMDATNPWDWTIWLNSCDFKDDGFVDDELKESAWAHASRCGKCHEGWKDCGGGDRVMFGKEFKSLCHSPLMFTDPDTTTLEYLQKLMLIVN